MTNTKTYIRTAGDRRFDFMAIDPTVFDLGDMALALSQICRFTGHTSSFYTVAHHSLLVAELVEPQHELEALMHDAHETYVGDMATPMKEAVGAVASAYGCKVNPYRLIEHQVETALRQRYWLPWKMTAAVKAADRLAYEIERNAFWRGEYHEGLNRVRHMPRRVAGREWFLTVSHLLEGKGVSL